jgi:hypothetical protein
MLPTCFLGQIVLKTAAKLNQISGLNKQFGMYLNHLFA